MLRPVIDSIIALLTSLLGHELGTNEFAVVAGVALFAALIVCRLLAGFFGSKRGIILTSFAVLFPVFMGLVAYGVGEVYGQPKFEEASFVAYIPWAAFGLLTVCSIMVVTKRLLGLSFVISVIIFSLGLAAGAGAFVCSDVIVDFLDKSGTELEKREDEITKQIKDAV